MAEAVFRHLVNAEDLSDKFLIASAGTGSWHAGEPPHRGTQSILKENQIEVGNKKAQQLTRPDVRDYEYIIAMDSENVHDIQASFGRRVPRLLEFAPRGSPLDVPDPYYSGGFDQVYWLVLAGCQGLLAYIREKENI
jgi:protein-tyrosine phosphatase